MMILFLKAEQPVNVRGYTRKDGVYVRPHTANHKKNAGSKSSALPKRAVITSYLSKPGQHNPDPFPPFSPDYLLVLAKIARQHGMDNQADFAINVYRQSQSKQGNWESAVSNVTSNLQSVLSSKKAAADEISKIRSEYYRGSGRVEVPLSEESESRDEMPAPRKRLSRDDEDAVGFRIGREYSDYLISLLNENRTDSRPEKLSNLVKDRNYIFLRIPESLHEKYTGKDGGGVVLSAPARERIGERAVFWGKHYLKEAIKSGRIDGAKLRQLLDGAR